MPLYAFHCESCGQDFETLVRSSDTPACPTCESTRLSRHLSLIARPARGGEDAGTMACGAGAACSNEGSAAPCGAGACCFADADA